MTTPEPITSAPALLTELQQLHVALVDDGISCSLSTRPVDTLLIGTPSGGIITVALTTDQATWWAHSTRGQDLTGASLTVAVLEELHRGTHHDREQDIA
ncbi:hypothetical protein [Tsukamurella hominis]|uniref:hypothetical protein n=1 Tax=Tsukamurella hominis TaxID=1970232 RepID=UPI0039ED6834